MNVLFTTYQGHNEGSTQSITFLCKGLARRGHNVFLACRKESFIYELMKDSDVQIIPSVFKGKFDRSNMRHIREIVKTHNIDLINAQASLDRYSTIFARWFYKLDVKLVHTRRQKPESDGLWIQNWLYSKKTDKIVAVSEGVKEGLVKLGIPATHVKVIHNGTPKSKYENIDSAVTEELRQYYGIRQGDKVIGCVSRKKKQLQILQALQYLDFPVKMIFIGIPEPPQFSEISSSYTVDHQVFFEGKIPPPRVLSHYALFDINILASTMEGLSQSLLEAMAMNVPVIATAASGNLDLIKDRENGLLFEDGNPEQISEKITSLYESPQKMHELAKAGKKTALEDYSIEKTIDKYEAFFMELINS
ncbi:MAG: glycosyltransferase family 4 protein [Cyclobacteriaceae bacterium]